MSINLKERRKELKLSLQKVADACGVSKSTVKRWEDKDIDMRRDKVDALAHVLQISPLDIIGSLGENETDLYSLILKKARLNLGYSIEDIVKKSNGYFDVDTIVLIEKSTFYVHTSKVDIYSQMVHVLALRVLLKQTYDSWLNKSPLEQNYYEIDHLDEKYINNLDLLVEDLTDELQSRYVLNNKYSEFEDNLSDILHSLSSPSDMEDAMTKILEYASFITDPMEKY